jgi:cytochrome c biogenesis protein CcmG/thiol:disulfide interchange protein DsbE
MIRFAIPLGIFVILVIFLIIGLNNDPRYIPSPLIDKPAPAFSLPTLDAPAQSFSPQQYLGKVWLFNAWTSDCSACRQEHHILLQLAKLNVAPLVGLNYRDNNSDAQAVLQQLKNPYSVVVTDHRGRVGIDYGVYAVPETFVIDKKGIIRYKYIGPLNPKVLHETVLPLLKKLNEESA